MHISVCTYSRTHLVPFFEVLLASTSECSHQAVGQRPEEALSIEIVRVSLLVCAYTYRQLPLRVPVTCHKYAQRLLVEPFDIPFWRAAKAPSLLH